MDVPWPVFTDGIEAPRPPPPCCCCFVWLAVGVGVGEAEVLDALVVLAESLDEDEASEELDADVWDVDVAEDVEPVLWALDVAEAWLADAEVAGWDAGPGATETGAASTASAQLYTSYVTCREHRQGLRLAEARSDAKGSTHGSWSQKRD